MTMPFPGLKVLDEILAGLPTNSAQRLEIAKLKEQITILQAKDEKLEKENALHTSKQNMSIDTLKILQFLFVHDRSFSAEEIGETFELEIGVAKYHCDTLRSKRLVVFRTGGFVNHNRPIEFEISPAGRAYLVESGLVPIVPESF